MKYSVREATQSVDPKDPYKEGKVIGIVEGDNDYVAAVAACQKLFKSSVLPLRETGWPNEGGLFFTAKMSGVVRVKDKPFFLRPSR